MLLLENTSTIMKNSDFTEKHAKNDMKKLYVLEIVNNLIPFNGKMKNCNIKKLWICSTVSGIEIFTRLNEVKKIENWYINFILILYLAI